MGAVVAIDLPEHGEDEDLDPGLVAQLQGVSAVIEQLALRELVLIGHSMGTLPALLLHSPPREIVRANVNGLPCSGNLAAEHEKLPGREGVGKVPRLPWRGGWLGARGTACRGGARVTRRHAVVVPARGERKDERQQCDAARPESTHCAEAK